MLDNTYSPAELDELSEGLGDKVVRLLRSHNNYGGCCLAQDEIRAALSEVGVEESEVNFEVEPGEFITVQDAFWNAFDNYKFQDQFDG